MIAQNFTPAGATQNIAVTATSQAVTLNAAAAQAETVRFVNRGTQIVFVELTAVGSAPTATTTESLPILANSTQVVTFPRPTHVACVATTTGSTLYITTGFGG